MNIRIDTSHRTALSIAVIVAASAMSPATQAQQLVIEEVVVTAQKRAQNAQDVPVALTAISADVIDQTGIQTTQDVVRLAPSLTVVEGNQPQNSAFSLRGIGTNTFGIGVEQGVAMLVDDVAAVQQGQTMGSLMDIERIEVLRGPQSTLFGKSASAGVISITTKAPSDELEGALELSATDDDETRIMGSISGPVTDALAYRLTGLWSDRDGYIDNLTPGEKDKNGTETTSARGKLRWDINATVQLDLTAYYMKDDAECCVLGWNALDPESQLFGFIPEDPAAGITPGDSNYKARTDDGARNDATTKGGSVRFNAELGEFSLISITAIDEWELNNDEDVDFGDLDVLSYLSGGTEHGGLYSNSWIKTDFFSQEFRLVSPSREKYEYLVGLYYANADTDRTFFRNLSLAPADYSGETETESYAVFGQVTWHFTEATSITTGLRWNNEDISADFQDYAVANAAPISGNDSDSVVVGKASLQHFFTEDIMAYTSYTRGYKGQAFDLGADFSEEKAQNPVSSESSDSYELGVKSTLWDGRLQLNAVAFYATYDDFQVTRQNTDNEGGITTFDLDNVGELETKGVELETLALLSENINLTLNASYLDASVNDYIGAECWVRQTEAEGCIDGNQDIDGGELPIAPEWKYTAMLDYQLPLQSMPFNAFANILYTWQDDVIFNVSQSPNERQDSYGLTNLRVGLNDKSDRYRLTFFVNNLFDEHFASDKIDLPPVLFSGDIALVQVLPRNSQRYAGVQARFNF
jgi:iron complex outermembrane recepter protein